MKKENILLPTSIIILGGCLILSAWVVSDGLKSQEHLEISKYHYSNKSTNDF
ncbi:hypothetical protein H9647_25390 [Paenibacillus sp. Sa2BVA9]|uniref:Lipoprotein n=1 Tax=Paenibacillus gallinarum TaxID=2762232 RepID=A0ABR8T6N8_9BACL|nr:hypothetical protein [Paenibacillus gallinarum]